MMRKSFLFIWYAKVRDVGKNAKKYGRFPAGNGAHYSLNIHEKALLIQGMDILNQRYLVTGLPPKLSIKSLWGFLMSGRPASKKNMWENLLL